MRLDPVPRAVRRSVIEWHGAAGERWLASVPGTAERLMRTWGLRRGGPPFHGGTHSYVIPVERADGESAVLKVVCRDEENRAEPTALHAYDGDGAVRILEYEPESGAMLLEAVDPGVPLTEQEFPGLSERAAARERLAIACELYRRLWRPAPEPAEYPDFPKGSELLMEMEARFAEPDAAVLERLGREWADRAARCCSALRGPVEAGIANRDTHMGNVLSSRREPWLLIDPKPYLAERAFDGGYLVYKQSLHGPLGGAEAVRAVAEALGAELERVRAWAVLRGLEIARSAEDRDEAATSLAAVASILE